MDITSLAPSEASLCPCHHRVGFTGTWHYTNKVGILCLSRFL